MSYYIPMLLLLISGFFWRMLSKNGIPVAIPAHSVVKFNQADNIDY